MCPDRQFRDPIQALALAERAMNLTHGKDPNVRLTLGAVCICIGQYAQAIATWESCLGIPAIAATVVSNIAHALACCPDEGIRDGRRALELSRRACEATAWNVPWPLEVMAASCAETGSFDEAVTYQRKALSLLQDGDGSADACARKDNAEKILTNYLAGRPYRLD